MPKFLTDNRFEGQLCVLAMFYIERKRFLSTISESVMKALSASLSLQTEARGEKGTFPHSLAFTLLYKSLLVSKVHKKTCDLKVA